MQHPVLASTNRRAFVPDPAVAGTEHQVVVPKVLDVEQTAGYLNTTPRHVRRLYTERRIPYTKVGRSVRFLVADLDAWLLANRVEEVV